MAIKRLVFVLTTFGFALTACGCLPSDAEIAGDMEYERRAAYQEWMRQRERGESSSAKVDGPLSIDDAIKLALQYNKNLQSNIQDRDIARARRIAAWNVALPNVTVAGDVNLTERAHIAGTGMRTSLDSYSTSVRVTQPIMQGERIPATIRRSRFFTALTDETIRATIQELIVNVATSYYDVLLAQHLLDTNQEAVVSAEAQLRVVSEKRKQETATDYDVLRAQVDVATYRAQMLSQQNSIDTNRVALLKFMGVSQDSEITFSDKLEFLPMRPIFERAVEIASGLRPDLRQAALTARMNDEAVKIAQSGYWPLIGAAFSQGWSDGQTGRDAFKRERWGAGLSAEWSLGVDTYGDIEESKAVARQSRIQILDAQENMLREIRQQMNSLANAEEVVKALEVNLSAAREALRLVEIGYQAGVRTELDVQDARKALTDVQGQYYTALSDHTKARLNLQLAMGVLGPQRVDGGMPRGSSVPIANIQEFAATDYQPLDEDTLLNNIRAGNVERNEVAAPAAGQGEPSASIVDSISDEDFSYNDEAAPAYAQPVEYREPAAPSAPASLPIPATEIETEPVLAQATPSLPPPPYDARAAARSDVPATEEPAIIAAPVPAPEPEAAPMFKVKVRSGS